MAIFSDIKTWTDRLGHTGLRSFTDKRRHFWLEQNPAKNSKWAKLASQGHEMAWEFASPGGSYTGRLLIDGGDLHVGRSDKEIPQCFTPNGKMTGVPAEDRIIHLKQRDKAPSETVCEKPMYTLGPEHSIVEHQEGAKITCPDCKERFIR